MQGQADGIHPLSLIAASVPIDPIDLITSRVPWLWNDIFLQYNQADEMAGSQVNDSFEPTSTKIDKIWSW